jgi:sugar phosphate isomerase/epimerase
MPSQPMGALELLDVASKLGVSVVQFADNLPLHRLSASELASLRQAARSLEINVEVGTRGIDPGQLSRYLEIAQLVGSPLVRVVVDEEGNHHSPAEALGLLRESEKAFRAAGIRLAIENHDRYTVAELAKLVVSLGDWAGICLDTVNSFGALEGPAVVISTLAPLAINLHIKDFDVVRIPEAMGFSVEGRAVGEGRLGASGLVHELSRFGNVQSGIIELWTPRQPTLDGTIALEAEWARRSVLYLRDAIGLG